MSSVFAGLAASTKVLGLATVAFVLTNSFLFTKKAFGYKIASKITMFLFSISLVVYTFVHYIHLSILTKNGPGSVWMSPSFQSTLAASDSDSTLSLRCI